MPRPWEFPCLDSWQSPLCWLSKMACSVFSPNYTRTICTLPPLFVTVLYAFRDSTFLSSASNQLQALESKCISEPLLREMERIFLFFCFVIIKRRSFQSGYPRSEGAMRWWLHSVLGPLWPWKSVSHLKIGIKLNGVYQNTGLHTCNKLCAEFRNMSVTSLKHKPNP